MFNQQMEGGWIFIRSFDFHDENVLYFLNFGLTWTRILASQVEVRNANLSATLFLITKKHLWHVNLNYFKIKLNPK